MPIKPELRHFYGKTRRTVTRPRILERAGNCCETCGVANYSIVPGRTRPFIRVVLTVAHLNHMAGDDRDENLKALCQRDHLALDKNQHAESRASRKDLSRPILEALTSANV